jgi:hypothetical protein
MHEWVGVGVRFHFLWYSRKMVISVRNAACFFIIMEIS